MINLRPWMTATIVLGVVCCFVEAQTMEPWEQPGSLVGQEIVGPDGGTYVWVPPGEFMMGSGADDLDARDNEKPQHRVRITKGYWAGKHEVTNGQYRTFCEATGREFPQGHPRIMQGDDHPVVWVSWHDAQAYCDHYGFRLPSEAEWEYMARGPEGSTFPWGDKWDPQKLCWWETRAGEWASAVGSFPDGASWVGAQDLAGNVWEWCADWYDQDYYGNCPGDDPKGPEDSTAGDLRILRGGSWASDRDYCRSAFRLPLNPQLRMLWSLNDGASLCGFRCVVSPR